MDKKRMLVGIILFGSLWGFLEVIIGSSIANSGYPSGGLMTGFFAIPLLFLTRLFYKQRGMQFGMGLVAGSLRVFNPFMGCHICSAIAIMAEGALFELIFTGFSIDLNELKKLTSQSSIGIISAYILYIGGYIVTQVLTPVIAGSGFFIENLIVFLPKILAGGILPALIATITVPLIISVKKLDISIKDKIYYPTSAGISISCWIIVIIIWGFVSL